MLMPLWPIKDLGKTFCQKILENFTIFFLTPTTFFTAWQHFISGQSMLYVSLSTYILRTFRKIIPGSAEIQL